MILNHTLHHQSESHRQAVSRVAQLIKGEVKTHTQSTEKKFVLYTIRVKISMVLFLVMIISELCSG